MIERSSDVGRVPRVAGRATRLPRAVQATRDRLSRTAGDERGAIIVFVAVILIVVLASAGLGIDLGRGYLEQARLSRAVDASALAAARALRQGQAVAQAQATAVQRTNGIRNGLGGVSTSIEFGTNENGEATVTVRATRPIPTTFMRVLGHQTMNLGAMATAAVPPVDLVLVLDQSGSLGQQGAWDELQAAATSFVNYFSDDVDQVGLVSYQIRAADRFLIGPDFRSPISQAISLMRSVGDTNTGEGLRYAEVQLTGPTVRPEAAKVVVFFTDGRPTAVRRQHGPPWDRQDRVLAVSTIRTGRVRGMFDDPDSLPIDRLANPDDCAGASNCYGINENGVRNQARQEGLQKARDLRREGVLIYAIGLGNPGASDPLLVPDIDYLEDIANVNGRGNPSEPQGKVFFAPSVAELQQVFDEVARDLIVRLAQ